MGMFRSTCLSLPLGFAVIFSLFSEVRAQAFAPDVAASLSQLDLAICLQQWGEAIDITSGLIASPDVSSAYRQELLSFRRQLQSWQVGPVFPDAQASCDRTLPLFLALDEPEPPEPQPLDWNRALASLRNSRPIIQLNDGVESTPELIPTELTASSPELLTNRATPIDTTDGFNVLGDSINSQQQVYSFLARLGDRVSLEVDITRAYSQGDAQLYVFDQTGRLITKSDSPTFQGGAIQDFVSPKTDVYFAVVSSQGTLPVLDERGQLVDWQTTDNSSFDYTLTLTGVTPYNVLLP
ncbi:hypothetical protein [Leptothoe spongobia]|uniref:Uncharacterized protein n=1 Tax=Leptothoe spongobia TAU-MAC 1115 TaxID=1967444 RepID=A0A947DGP5_9CYAN|nr:hypothetical protein [Leptothoe spongobia]MBT9316425.1 hypothetical protein [Leptothoe spongobia TAU-MAC 1115]